MADMPMPLKGKIWIPERDSEAAKHGTYKSQKQIKDELERELRVICREHGCERIATIEARARAQEKRTMRAIHGLPEDVSHDELVELTLARPAKPEKPPKPVKPKKLTAPDGWITISEWAKKWKIEPADARAALRGSGLTKPDFGWSFDPKDEKKIKKLCGVK